MTEIKIFNQKFLFLFVTLLIILFGLFHVIQGYSMVGKSFPGFAIGFSLMVAPDTKSDWTGHSAEFHDYERIIAVNGKKVINIHQFHNFIQELNPGTPVKYTFQRDNKNLIASVPVMEFTLKDYINTFLVSFFVALLYLFIAIFVILYSKITEQVKALIIFSLIFSISFCTFSDLSLTHKFVPLGLFCEVFLGGSLLQLGFVLNKHLIKDKVYKSLLILNLIIATLIAFPLSITTAFMINELYNSQFIYDLHFLAFNLTVAYIAFSFLLFCGLITYNYLKSPIYSLEKIQSRIILTGSILSFTPYIVFWLIPLAFGFDSSIQYLLIPFIAFPFFLSYSIIRYKAFDIEIYIRKGLIYSTLTIIGFIGYFSLSSITVYFYQKFFYDSSEIPIVFAAIITTIFASRIHKVVQDVIDKAFYRHKFDLTILLEKFINDITNIFDKNELIQICISYLEKSVNPISVTLYLLNKQNNNLQLLHTNNGFFPKEIKRNSSNFLEKSQLLNNFKTENNFTLLLEKDNNTVGLLLLDSKKSEVEYLSEEKNFLKSFGSTLAMALNTIILEEETMDLSIKNLALEKNSKFLNQLTSNLSHDLKFPIVSGQTTIKKLIYMINKKSAVKLEFIQDSLEVLNKLLGKVNEYISISLDREMISLGKLVISKEKIDVLDSCEEVIQLHIDFLEINLKVITFQVSEGEFFILGDRARFENVISNLISNAGKYGGNRIAINIDKIDSDVVIKISDNGSGIKESIKDKVFECYVQDGILTNSGTDRSTGLGLFICKKYIEIMGGSIWFESDTQKGTTFFIKIPEYATIKTI